MGWTSNYKYAGLRAIAIFITCMGLLVQTRVLSQSDTKAQALPWFESHQSDQSDTDRPPNTSGQSAGSRGCVAERNIDVEAFNTSAPLTILAPDLEAKFTTLGHPTFAWLMSFNTYHSIEFRLYQYQTDISDIELFYSAQLGGEMMSSGIKLFTLPASLPPLSSDYTYIWQVEVVCDPNRPSGNLFVESEVKRIQINIELQQVIQGDSPLSEKIKHLNQENLWLDALSLSLQTNNQPHENLEQLAIASSYPELHELSRQFPIYFYTTGP